MNKLIEIEGLLRDPNLPKNHADDNVIIPFKGRTIDADKPIDVYRNLNRKGKWYSIKQGSLVVGHTTAICLRHCDFIVNKSGKERAIKTMQRNVHAFIRGYYATSLCGTTAKDGDLPMSIHYRPFENRGFYSGNHEVIGAQSVVVNENGVRGAYTFIKT